MLQIVNQMIEHNLNRANIQDDSTEKEVWKYENSLDYHHGRTIGLLTRILREEFEKYYKRPATPQEVIEIVVFLGEHSIRIRRALAFLKR